ncbi:MAG: TaqI-like C-terminal specificity domain-containing protein [bacterium]|nr:TaqI-like C-terminal specificity domain-containing protein [bacterium]
MPIEILGQVYEQFLGKVIRLTAGHHAKVEEKPEVRKAGGVYYTPQYIVDYIVKNTVRPLLDPKPDPSPTSPRSGERLASLTPKEIESVKILDPACGSGSFLIGAYKYLLEYHLNWYTANEPKKYPKAVFTDGRGAWRLTTQEAKKILLNNIFGVDIDSQAVEVTKLSLLLKVLENESREGMEQQLKMFKERALPNIDGNIKCGNSLIGPDFYEGQLSLQDTVGTRRAVSGNEDGAKINPFDWEREFPEIMKRGGFDAVIGNPPYVRQEALGEFKDYFKANYKVFHGVADLYAYFIERGISLLRDNGIFTYIVANKWMRASYGEPLRHWLKQQNIVRIIDFGDLPVFQNATTYPCILSVAKSKAGGAFATTQVKTLEFTSLSEYVEQNKYKVRQAGLEDNGWSLSSEIKQKLLDKLKLNSIPLGDYVKGEIYLGVKTGLNEAFIIDSIAKKKLIQEDPKSKELIKPLLLGKDIKRYQNPAINQFIIFIPKGWTRSVSGNVSDKWLWFKKAYPAIVKHLEPFEEAAKKRQDQGEYWWELRSCDYYDKFETPKIIYPDLAIRGSFLLDDKGNLYSGNTTYIIPVNDKNLLGVLNSKAVTFFYKKLSSVFRGGYLRYFTQYVVQIPIPKGLAQNKALTPFVEKLISLNINMAGVVNPNEKETIVRQIAATDKQIDKLVYELYGLTEEEIKVVEGE